MTIEDEAENILVLKNSNYCPRCRYIRSKEDYFCGICGTKLTNVPRWLVSRRCILCRCQLDIIDHYCPACGLYSEEPKE